MIRYSTATLLVAGALFVYWILMALIGAMLPPESGKERTRYGYWYRVGQLVAANIQRAAERKYGDLAGPPPGTLAVEHTESHLVAATERTIQIGGAVDTSR